MTFKTLLRSPERARLGLVLPVELACAAFSATLGMVATPLPSLLLLTASQAPVDARACPSRERFRGRALLEALLFSFLTFVALGPVLSLLVRARAAHDFNADDCSVIPWRNTGNGPLITNNDFDLTRLTHRQREVLTVMVGQLSKNDVGRLLHIAETIGMSNIRTRIAPFLNAEAAAQQPL